MDLLKQIIVYALFPFGYLSRPESQYFLPTYFTTALVALAIYMIMKRRRALNLQAIRALLFPPRLLEHPSTSLDFKMVFIGLYYLVLQVLTVGGTTLLTVAGTAATLTHLFGAPAHAASGPSLAVTLSCMFFVFLAVEFGYWFSHWLMHKVPALWEFHKVHHSAQVLTPLTEWRQHPVELNIFPMLMGISSCLVQGPFVWWYGENAFVLDPLRANLLSMAFWYTILHLRHTELPFYATGLLGKIIQAPAHHQVHHSTNPAHYDTNMGYCLSIFDWMFGTLYVPKKGEKFVYGLGHQDDALETVVGSILTPIGRVIMMGVNAVRGKANHAPQ